MRKLLVSIAALALPLVALPALAVSVTPPATGWKSSLTEPEGAGSDWVITKSSQAQVKVSSGNVTFQLKLNGVVDGSNMPVTEAGNTFEIQLRYGGLNHTLSDFTFDLNGGKTDNSQTKFTLANGALPGGGVGPDDSIEVLKVRCLQGGTGGGAGNSFCSAGLTAK